MNLLKWDSEFFGHRIGRLNSLEGDWQTLAKNQGVDCLYCLVNAADVERIRVAESAGFHLMDLRVTLSVDTASFREGMVPDLRVRPAQPEDLPLLEHIAAGSHHDTRFYADRRFPSTRADEMYRIWIRRSCADPEGRVWVLDEGAGASGYSTCDRDGKIGLVAVAENARGRGGGRAMVMASLSWFAGRGTGRVSVVTQGRNIAAQRLYQSCGFTTSSVELWYHKWF